MTVAHAEALAGLRRWLKCYRQLRLDRLPPGCREPPEPWAFSSFADLVLRHGRLYPPAPWPYGGHPRPGDCFAAAHEWADREPGWTYVEGYAWVPGLVECPAVDHAWCLTADGVVADPALEDGQAALYWGVPLTGDFRRGQGRGRDAVSTFGRDLSMGPNLTILRDGLPPHAIAQPAP